MPHYTHCGLYFTPDHIQQAQEQREREPFAAAWTLLDQHKAATWDDELILDGFRCRLNNQVQAGEQAVIALQNGVGLDAGESRFEALAAGVTLAQAFELVRDHPAFSAESQRAWLSRFKQRVEQLKPASAEAEPLVEQVWWGLLNIAAGVALEADALVESGAEIYRQTVQNHIRPEGYLTQAVEGADGGSLRRQLLSVAALALMAEAAAHIGVDLWSYQSRGISVITATLYCIYYYYYPDQWRWDTINEADSNTAYQQYGGFLEIVNRRAQPQDVKLLFEDLRPLFHPLVGGLTTLTHGLPARRRLFG